MQERENYLVQLKEGKFRVSNESPANTSGSETKQHQERIFIHNILACPLTSNQKPLNASYSNLTYNIIIKDEAIQLVGPTTRMKNLFLEMI